MMRTFLTNLLLLSVFVLCAFSCRSLQFYKELDKPFYYLNKETIPVTKAIDSVNVVTYNIKKAVKIDMAIAELKELEKTKSIDICLLQEMDQLGVETIADALNLNYLYIPIAYDNADKKNIGNAILTKGTIAYPEKLILPHAKWQNQQRRDVTIGEVNIHQKKILVFSVHTETPAMGRTKRMNQIDSVIQRGKMLLPKYKHVIIGGDFNTLFPKDVKMVVEKFNSNGFEWSTATVGSTAKGLLGLVKPHNDHLFTKGFTLLRANTIYTARASDHFPVVATFKY